MEERRCSTRTPVDTRMLLAAPGVGLVSTRTYDISAGGACVQIQSAPLERGTLVHVVSILRNGASVMGRHLRAVVVHISEDRCGLMFTNLDSATFDMVADMRRAGRTAARSPSAGGRAVI